VYRHPIWHQQELHVDPDGQPINGVLNVNYTHATGRPIWSPIDTQLYEAYMQGNGTPQDRDALIEQITFVIYTVRNNTFHGGKEHADENARRVVRNAHSLLGLIVRGFLLPPDQW
jgi:hypothetical protein